MFTKRGVISELRIKYILLTILRINHKVSLWQLGYMTGQFLFRVQNPL